MKRFKLFAGLCAMLLCLMIGFTACGGNETSDARVGVYHLSSLSYAENGVNVTLNVGDSFLLSVLTDQMAKAELCEDGTFRFEADVLGLVKATLEGTWKTDEQDETAVTITTDLGTASFPCGNGRLSYRYQGFSLELVQ